MEASSLVIGCCSMKLGGAADGPAGAAILVWLGWRTSPGMSLRSCTLASAAA